MKRILLTLILGCFGTIANAEMCFLQIENVIHMEGTCSFDPTGDGGFYATDLSNNVFAVLGTVENGAAMGFWNEYESHAHSPLGTLNRYAGSGCWQNDSVTFCAWR